MISILLGAVLGSLGGFKAQEIVPRTETFHIQNILNNGQFTLIPKTSARINDFWITYTNKRTINQFYSHISILNNEGNEIQQETIYVNSPAKYNGITYYQTDWNVIGLRIKGKTQLLTQYPLTSILADKDKTWLSWVPIDSNLNEGVTVLINNLQGYCSIYNKFGEFVGNLELNESIQVSSFLTLIDIISSTGLQIKSDPGIPIIYGGFVLLMISTLISYITYSQIWVMKDEHKLYIGGNTTRATFDFEQEFFKIIK